MENNKPPEEFRNINTIMFDRKGNMIRGEFGIADIINLMEQRDDMRTFASYNAPEQSNDRNETADNHRMSGSFHVDSLKQCMREEKYDELPALVLLMPKYM